ncbi:MAG: T9SS C-terminal target domain-containing protein, partial [Ignavibacteriae bacterium]
PFQGIYTNKILVNRIDEFRKQNLKILFPPNSQYRAINFLTRLDQALSASMSQEITGFSGAWNGTLFLNSEKDHRYRFPISLSAFIIQDKSLTREWSASAPFRIFNDSVGMYSGVTPPKSIYLSSNDGSMTLGGGPVYTNAALYNNFFAASNIAASPRFYWALDDEKKVSVNEPQYIISDSGGAMISSNLPSTTKGLNVPAGVYTLEVTNRDYYVRSKQGKATLKTRFDLRKADANPPQISSLRLLDSGGKSVDMLAVDEQGTLIFSSADIDYVKDEYGTRVGVYKHINAHATQLSYRVNGTATWHTTLVSPWMVDTAGSNPRGIVYKSDLTAATHVDGKAIDLKLLMQDLSGNSTEWSLEPAFGVGSFENSTGVDEKTEFSLPGRFALRQNYPNPFNPMTMIEFDIPQSSFVTLEIFNTLGQKISTVLAKDLQAGTYKIPWNAAGVSTGIYFYRLQAGSIADTKKFLLLK